MAHANGCGRLTDILYFHCPLYYLSGSRTAWLRNLTSRLVVCLHHPTPFALLQSVATMLALAQLQNLPAVLKRRNSKQIQSPSSLVLPGNIRRFSSTEMLNNQQPLNPPPVATVARRSSLSRKLRKTSSANVSSDVNSDCMQLDLLFTKIKRKLAEFREEDMEIVDRVDDLVTSVGYLCEDYRVDAVTTPLSASLVQLVHQYPSDKSLDQFQSEPTRPLVFRKKSNSSSEDDDDFKKFCQTHGHSVSNTHTLPNFRWSANSETNRSTTTGREAQTKRWSAMSADHTTCPSQHQMCSTEKWVRFNIDNHTSRPLSYQEISYEEEEDKNTPIVMEDLAGWDELSCP